MLNSNQDIMSHHFYLMNGITSDVISIMWYRINH